MLAQQRHARILASVESQGSVRVSDLVRELGVSDMTVRRDLDAMQRAGLIQKVHGGAVLREQRSAYEPGFAEKSTRELAEKEAIGAAAAALVEEGSAIALSAGTTTHALARHLVAIPGLTVVTNSVWVADFMHSADTAATSILLTGGLRTPSDALVGPLAIEALSALHVDTVFLGVHGMDVKAGFSTPNLMEAETNRAMIACGQRLVVVADSTKWGVVGLSSMARLDEADVVVTDAGLPAEATEALASRVGELVVVDPDSPRGNGAPSDRSDSARASRRN